METDRKDSGDPGMLGLFREELAGQLRVLESGLAEIEQGLSSERMDRLRHAVHAIKGAFRVVGLPVAVSLAYAMEEVLSEFGQAKRRPLPIHIDQLWQAAKIFQAIQNQEGKDISGWVTGQEASMRRVTQALWKFLAETEDAPFAESFATASPPDETPGEVEAPIIRVRDVEEAPDRSDMPNMDGGEIPTWESEGQSLLQVQLNQDELLALTSECLLQARKIRELHPLLQSLERGAPEIVMSSFPKERDPADDDGKAPATDPLQLFDRSSQQLEHLTGQLFDNILASRMTPFASLIRDYPSRISDLAGKLGKVVTFNMEGDMTTVDRDSLRKLEAPLWRLIRHVLVYSLETPAERESAGKTPTGFLSLIISSHAGMLDLIFNDDGRGINQEDLKVVVGDHDCPERTQETSGSVTLGAMLASLDGSVDWEFLPGEGTKVHLALPAIPCILNCLLVRISGESYALPMAGIDRVAIVPHESLQSIESRPCALIDEENIFLIDVGQIFNLAKLPSSAGDLPVIVLKRGQQRCGLVVEAFLGEEKLVLRSLDERLGKVSYIRAAAILEDGSPTLVLDMNDLFEAV